MEKRNEDLGLITKDLEGKEQEEVVLEAEEHGRQPQEEDLENGENEVAEQEEVTLEGEVHEEEPQEEDLEDEGKEVAEQEEVALEGEELEHQDTDNDFSLDELIPVKTKAISKVFGDPGVLSIIKSSKGGKRLSFANTVMEKLNNPDKLQVALARKGIVIGENIPNRKTDHFPVKVSGAKGVIYSGGLVEEITKEYNLDFSNRVSITFHKVVYKSINGETLAFFKLAE